MKSVPQTKIFSLCMLVFFDEFSGCLAVGEVEEEFYAATMCIEVAVSVAVGGAVEALVEEVSLCCDLSDVVLLFQLSESFPVHDE